MCRYSLSSPALCALQGQASDILIQAREIERLRDLLIQLYVRHAGQETATVGELKQLQPHPCSTAVYCCRRHLLLLCMDADEKEITARQQLQHRHIAAFR